MDNNVFNPLNAELDFICHLLALLEAHHILHVSRIRVKYLKIRFGNGCSNINLFETRIVTSREITIGIFRDFIQNFIKHTCMDV